MEDAEYYPIENSAHDLEGQSGTIKTKAQLCVFLKHWQEIGCRPIFIAICIMKIAQVLSQKVICCVGRQRFAFTKALQLLLKACLIGVVYMRHRTDQECDDF
ncbi:hypothetical protein DT23_10230 [Thioclava indica]|uniref:Uncharacterized protein n=1 Tax=Thioclava indica TaxID=1353528 RepID=A0A074K034_9RHOB|nr:hypothetical protein DT23_10230 [Thioclava indica]